MNTMKKHIVAGVISFLLTSFAAAQSDGLLSDESELFIWTEMDSEILVGEKIQLLVHFQNRSTSRTMKIDSIIIEKDYFAGFEFLTVSPQMERENEEGDSLELTESIFLDPGDSMYIELWLIAKEVGIFSGELSIWLAYEGPANQEKLSLNIRALQTEVISR